MSTSSPSERRHDAYAAFRLPAYRRYLIGSVLMSIGTAGQTVAIGWEMYDRTSEPVALGLVGLTQAIPMLLLTLPAGYLADVFDRRRLMIISLLGTSATSLALAAFSYAQGSIVLMYVLLLFDSAFIRLGWPARAALLPLLVPESVFENAVKWRSSLGQVSAMVGPAVGGFLVAWWLPGAYLISAGSTLLFIGLLVTIPLAAAPRGTPGRMLEQVADGVRFVWRQRLLLGTISLDLFAVLLGGAVYLLPIYARDIINLSGVGLTPAKALGYLRAAPAAGALVTALLLAHLPPIQRAGRAMLLAVAGFGLATIVFGISRNLWLSLLMLALTGAFDNVSVVVRHTLVLLVTPNEMRGRVSAVNAMFISSSNELGGFESGTVAQLFGPVVSVVSGGIGTLAVTATWAGLFPRLRRFGRLTSQPQAVQTQNVAGPVPSDRPAASR